jgi:hypothetical protein
MLTLTVIQVMDDTPISIEFETCCFEGVEAGAFGVGHFLEGALGEQFYDCEGLG